jgi:hypothetical protein
MTIELLPLDPDKIGTQDKHDSNNHLQQGLKPTM